MYLGIRTDSPTAELYLFDIDGKQKAYHEWLADRQLARELLAQIESFLTQNETNFDQLKGLFVYQGPGSFTGLRIGITTMNTISYSQAIPIVGTNGEGWVQSAMKRLKSRENDKIVLPEYGADPRITTPKK